MDTNEVAQQIRLKEWSNIIQNRIQSGMSVQDFCKSNGLSTDSFYYYQRKLRTRIIEDSGFVELPPVPTQTNADSGSSTEECNKPEGSKRPDQICDRFSTEMIIRTGDAEICINRSTPKSLISEVLEVLKDAE